MTITLRDIIPGDEPFLFQVYASTRAGELALVEWTDEQRAAFLKMQFAAQSDYYREQFPHADYKVILANGAAVGRLYVLRKEGEIRILDIALLPEQRRVGIGSSLIRELLREGFQSRKVVRIYVETFNPSLQVFERLGFQSIAEEGINFLMEWRPTA